MKRLLFLLALFCLPVLAQTVPATANVSWVLPTMATDGTPLTGAQVLTSVNLYVSTSVIPDIPAGLTPIVLSATASTTTATVNVANNATLHMRVNACNAGGCGALSNEATKAVSVPAPGVPTSVAITIAIKTS